MNFCLFLVGTIQTGRILSYNASQEGSLKEGVKDMGKELKGDAKKVEQQAETAGKELKAKV